MPATPFKKLKSYGIKGPHQAPTMKISKSISRSIKPKELSNSSIMALAWMLKKCKNTSRKSLFPEPKNFLDKYKSNNENDQFIGHFGLGFYSAYMVAEKVEINTLSYKPKQNLSFGPAMDLPTITLEREQEKHGAPKSLCFIDKDSDEYLEEPPT